MSWKYYLLIITLCILLVACLPLFVKANREAAREWMSGYAGLLAIAAAVIASIPVFQQLDEARLATKNIRIQLIAGAQKALDDERGRVDEVEKIAEDAILLHKMTLKERSDLVPVWRIKLGNLFYEMSQKTDKPPYLFAARADVGISADKLSSLLAISRTKDLPSELISVVEVAAQKLDTACEAYDKSSHNQIEQMHLRISEAEKELLDY